MDRIAINPKTYNFSAKEYRIVRDLDGIAYQHRFHVYKYKHTITLECEITIDGETGEVKVNVYDMNRVSYAPFYYIPCGNCSPLLDKVYCNIYIELRRLGIIK